MPKMMSLLLFAALPLSACAPAGNTDSAPTPAPATSPAPAATAAATPTPDAAASPKPAVEREPAAVSGGASISGTIREGNRSPPALRICAHPLDGSAPTCIDAPAGATEYRIEVAPGRYRVLGWVKDGELALIAHALQIRCVRAPCPPDELIEVEVASGEAKDGIVLAGGYVDVPAGWPSRP